MGWRCNHIRKAMMSGIEAWIATNHCQENFRVCSRHRPSGTLMRKHSALTRKIFRIIERYLTTGLRGLLPWYNAYD